MIQDSSQTSHDKRPIQEQLDPPRSKPRLNLNTATQEELIGLPGIGPALAKRILAGRPYRRVDDLLQVKGVGPKLLSDLRPLLEVLPIVNRGGPSSPPPAPRRP